MAKVKKVVLSISIREDIMKEFKEYCENNDMNKSRIVEKLIIKYMEEK